MSLNARRLALLPLSAVLTTALAAQNWIGTWATSPMPISPEISKTTVLGQSEVTLRQIVHISQGGTSVRVTLTNEFGKEPLTISAAQLALLASGDRILPSTTHALTFDGKTSVTIAAGQFLASDPIHLTLPIFSDVVISLDLPPQTMTSATHHALSMATSYLGAGNQVMADHMASPEKIMHWYFLKNIQVNPEKHASAIVAFGDSITDGARSTPDTNRRWPDLLATRLSADKHTKHVSILNEGISGNRILNEGAGPSALSRLDRDVLSAPGVKYVILLEAINDIGHAGLPRNEQDKVSTDQLIDGYKQIINQCHAKGLKIYGATLTPYLGAVYATPMGEDMRQKLNAFIRTAGNFDGVIDFEKVLEDPSNPGHINPKFDPGDHLHPNDAGYAAMGMAVNLKLFR